MCFLFPLISSGLIQPVLNQLFHEEVPPVIGQSDMIIMILMFVLIALLPISAVLTSKKRVGLTDQNTRSYMSGVNSGDDRHFMNSYGDPQSVYMANWYMTDLIGELKIMKPCLLISAGILVTMMLIIIGGAI
jgi:ech hydrogenase subunit A